MLKKYIFIMALVTFSFSAKAETGNPSTACKSVSLVGYADVEIIGSWTGECGNLASGSGRVKDKYGNQFFGDVKNGHLNCGEMHYQNGNLYRGCFYNNQFHGDATYHIINAQMGGYKSFVGSFNQGDPYCGEMRFWDGGLYRGCFYNSKFHGEGTLYYASSAMHGYKVFVGPFNQGYLNCGVMHFWNGDYYHGCFSNNNPIGKTKFQLEMESRRNPRNAR